MVEQSPQSNPAGIPIVGPINDVAINGITPAVETMRAFAREIAQMSGQALDRANQHIEELRKAQTVEETASIQADYLKESMEHAVQHTRKYIELLATFPHALIQPVNVVVEIAEAARHATAEKVERAFRGRP